MNQRTNVQVVGVAAGVTTIVIWLLGYFAPALMATAPTGLEAAITGIITVIVGSSMHHESTLVGKLE